MSEETGNLDLSESITINFLSELDAAIRKIECALLDRDLKALVTRSYGSMSVFDGRVLEYPEFSEVLHDMRAPLGYLAMRSELMQSGSEFTWDDLEGDFKKVVAYYSLVRKSLLNPTSCKEVSLTGHLRSHRTNFARRVLGVLSFDSSESDRAYEFKQLGTAKNRNLSLDFGELIKAWTNWPVLVRALLNLLGNASDHNPDTDLFVSVRVVEKSDTVELHVKDSGKGIDDEEQVFARGFSTGGASHSGIGLAASKVRLEAIGASLLLDGHGGPDGGAHFTITLPKHPPNQ